MADGGSYTKSQKVNSLATNTQNKKNPSKFYSNFLFKAIIVTLFLVIMPFFPSEAPNVDNPSIFSRWWELLHLIFVGIAVSYGLFSRKNDDLECENNSKFDNAQNYMTRLLQVPSVFDDEVDSPTGCDDNNINKIQTWSSQYHRNEPKLVVAKQNSNLDDDKYGVSEKPLLLPVRSLKSRVSDGKDVELVNIRDSKVYARSNSSPNPNEFSHDLQRISRKDGEGSRVSKGYARSNSSVNGKGLVNDSKRISGNARSMVGNKYGFVNGDEQVSRSLNKAKSGSSSRGFSSISRRSSSGDYGGLDDEESEEHKEKVDENVVLPSPIPWRSRSGRMEINREAIDSTLHSLPPSLEESGAAQLLRSRSSLSSRSSASSSPKQLFPSPSLSSPKRLSPSPSLSSESLAKSVEDIGRRKLVYSSHLPPPPPPPPPPVHKSQYGKSNSSKDTKEMSSHHKDLMRTLWSEPKDIGRGNREESYNRTSSGLESKARNGTDSSSVGKSVRTVRASEMMSNKRTQVVEGENERSEDIVSEVSGNSERKPLGYNPTFKTSFSEYPKETRDFLVQVLAGTDDDSASEDDHYEEEREETAKVEEREETAKTEEPTSDSVDEGPDVDKKADEFIAKFREQIRLQRIESIKRSTVQLKRSSIR
ncbi:uncharacterized protein LOC130800711 [Amaranthus tricolor]|uniref:uncharacterized protein LOC130800711 n=1 Tax=Amaranthus tricolor TaxID=29722 RepID=UPI00258D1866|nr:uncharacterized protein LOC130800711 [Amaranthus tricolor]